MSLLPTDPSNPLFRILNPGMPSPQQMVGAGPNFGGWQQKIGGLFGQPQRGGLGGLLKDPNFAFALLANSGYSPQKRSFGQILGQSALQAQGAAQQESENELMRRYREAQIQSLQNRGANGDSPFGAISPDKFTPESIKKFEETGKYSDLVRVPEQRQMVDTAEMRNFSFRESLPPAQREVFDNIIRQNYKTAAIGGVESQVRLGPAPQVTPLSTLETEANAAGAIAGSKKAGEVSGGAQAQAAVDLPTLETNAKYTIDLVRAIKNHPGKKFSVGIASLAPTVPGTPQADFVARLEQIKGKQFLEAYNTLRGAGQISETEGAKAEASIARMQRAQSAEAFDAAADEFVGVVEQIINNARKKAGKPKGEDPLGIR